MQRSFADLEYTHKKKQTRRDRFLAQIDRVTPWAKLEAVVAPFYGQAHTGRPPIGLARMLRMYVAQQCFGLSDEGIEDALYDSQAIRCFVGIDLGRESAPDATTLLRFRRLLEEQQLTQGIFDAINADLREKGLMLKEGSVVDATIIEAPSSTKNRDKARDAEMHSTKKGNEWHFGMKAHIGADAESGLVHTLVTTPANTSDVVIGPELLHGAERTVYADAGYVGVEKRVAQVDEVAVQADASDAVPDAAAASVAPGETVEKSAPEWRVAMRRGRLKALPDNLYGQVCRRLEYLKSHVRSKVEHAFHVVKNRFGLTKLRYKGLAKNTAQLYTLFGFANLLLAGRKFAAPRADGGMCTRIAS